MSKTELGFDYKTGKSYAKCPRDKSQLRHLNTKKRLLSTDNKGTRTYEVIETYQCDANTHRWLVEMDNEKVEL